MQAMCINPPQPQPSPLKGEGVVPAFAKTAVEQAPSAEKLQGVDVEKNTSPLRGEVDAKHRVGVRNRRIKPFSKRMQAHAQRLRHEMTDAERALWKLLRGKQLGVKFRRQQPIGAYIVDFVCPSQKLIVEADGGQHAQSAHDHKRDAFLKNEGYRTLRFWNNEILTNPNGVWDAIALQLKEML